MTTQLSEHFTYSRLLRFTLPSILMMIFTSIYGMVDGYFVSNFAGKSAFAAVNFIMPYVMILGGLGFVVGSGGTALIGKTLGEGNNEKANELFSFLIYFTVGLGIVVGCIGIATVVPVAKLLGAKGDMIHYCALYGRIVLMGCPFFMLQFVFQSFCMVASKPKLGLVTTLIAGCTNMILDALFVGLFKWGIVGAAAATVTSQMTGGLVPLIYFSRKECDTLRLGKTHFDGKALVKALTNGSSEFISNISMSLVGMLYNVLLLKYAGENGVSAYGVLRLTTLQKLRVVIPVPYYNMI